MCDNGRIILCVLGVTTNLHIFIIRRHFSLVEPRKGAWGRKTDHEYPRTLRSEKYTQITAFCTSDRVLELENIGLLFKKLTTPTIFRFKHTTLAVTASLTPSPPLAQASLLSKGHLTQVQRRLFNLQMCFQCLQIWQAILKSFPFLSNDLSCGAFFVRGCTLSKSLALSRGITGGAMTYTHAY